MKVAAIIPSHLASIRFPRKILLKIHGLEMIEHVRRRALMTDIFDEVYVATGDNEISDLVKSHGGNVINTTKNHSSGTSRIVEAAESIDASHIFLIQGDEPLILPSQIKALYEEIANNLEVDAWNATASLTNESQLEEHSIVKCIVTDKNDILYCFRKTPSFSNFKNQRKYIRKILGLIAYKREVLMSFDKYNPSLIETSESIEQLRLIENKYDFRSVIVEPALPSINELGDEEKVLDLLKMSNDQKQLLREVLSYS